MSTTATIATPIIPLAPIVTEPPSKPAVVVKPITPGPLVWTIEISKRSGERISYDFGPGLGMKDINQIQRAIRVEYNRMKRRSRLRVRSDERKAALPSKESVNGST